MKKSVLITAVAGSGKSTVCKALIKLGYEAYDIESIPGLFSLLDPNTDEVLEGKELGDLKEDLEADWVCDTEKLKALIANQKSDVAFYCGGTSRTEELMAQFDLLLYCKYQMKLLVDGYRHEYKVSLEILKIRGCGFWVGSIESRQIG